MFQCKPCSFRFIRDYRGDIAKVLVDIIDVDDGQTFFANLLPLRAVGDARNDPIPVPAFGDHGSLFMIARVEKQMPVGVLFGKMSNAANDASTPTGFGFDEHGYVLNSKLTVVLGLVDHRRAARGIRRTSEVVDK